MKYGAPIFIAIFCLLFFLTLQFASPSMVSQDDSYYHLAHALAYWHGSAFFYPTASVLSVHPVDLYYGYHLLLAPIVGPLYDHFGYQGILVGMKIFNSIVATLYFLALYFITISFSRWFLPALYDTDRVRKIGIFTVAFLLIAFPVFSFRASIGRPHLISSFLFLLTVLSTARGRLWPLFFIGLVYPFFYSLPFFVLIAPAMFLLVSSVFSRRIFLTDNWLPMIAAISGLLVGILVRPDTFSYLYQAFATSTDLYVRFSGEIPVAAELQSFSFNVQDFLWAIPVLVSFVFFIYILDKRIEDRDKHRSLIFIVIIELVLLILFFAFNRAIEYFAPLASFVVALVFVIFFTEGGNAGKFYFLIDFIKQPKFWKVMTIAGLFMFFAGLTALLGWSIQQPPYDLYQRAAEFIRSDSGGKGIVFTQGFDKYPRLVFYNSENRYIAGMESIFTYLYDKQKFWLWSHSVSTSTGVICGEKVCTGTDTEDVYQVVSKEFGAQYVFIDLATYHLTTLPLEERIKKDPRFKRVFTDPMYPGISVYKI